MSVDLYAYYKLLQLKKEMVQQFREIYLHCIIQIPNQYVYSYLQVRAYIQPNLRDSSEVMYMYI